MICEEMQKVLKNEGYFFAREVEGKGICALLRFAFTTGLVYGIDKIGYEGRYCYKNRADAIVDIALWEGVGDPAGNWIKHKGECIDQRNPNYIEEDQY
jgi:hypothetical protein